MTSSKSSKKKLLALFFLFTVTVSLATGLPGSAETEAEGYIYRIACKNDPLVFGETCYLSGYSLPVDASDYDFISVTAYYPYGIKEIETPFQTGFETRLRLVPTLLYRKSCTNACDPYVPVIGVGLHHVEREHCNSLLGYEPCGDFLFFEQIPVRAIYGPVGTLPVTYSLKVGWTIGGGVAYGGYNAIETPDIDIKLEPRT